MKTGMTCPHCGEHFGPKSGEMLRLGRLTLDTAARDVFIDGLPRGLGQPYKGKNQTHKGKKSSGRGKEFTILEALVRHPGTVFSREHLLDITDTWDTDGHVVEVWISRIRAGVKGAVEIRTRHGVGWSAHELGSRDAQDATPISYTELVGHFPKKLRYNPHQGVRQGFL